MMETVESLDKSGLSFVENEWVENTHDNPFWKQKSAVEVMTKFGRVEKLVCPPCARIMMTQVARWRIVLS